MITAVLYQVHVRAIVRKRVEITLVPTWLGRWFRRRTRVGVAYRLRSDEDEFVWCWLATRRYVGGHIESYIEAMPLVQIEDMSVEQLLLEETTDRKSS